MRGRLLNLVAAASLLLCAAVATLWVRGYWVSDEFGWAYHRADGSRVALGLTSGGGGLGAAVVTVPPLGLRSSGRLWRTHAPEYGGTDWSSFGRGGLGFYIATHFSPATGVRVVGGCVPAPLAFLATAALPALALRRSRRRSKAPGLCPRCGYDLRATPDRCPECGSVPAG